MLKLLVELPRLVVLVALTLLSRLLQLSELSSLLTAVHLHLALVEMVTLVTTAIEHWSPMSVAVGLLVS